MALKQWYQRRVLHHCYDVSGRPQLESEHSLTRGTPALAFSLPISSHAFNAICDTGVSEVSSQILRQVRSAAFFCSHNPRYTQSRRQKAKQNHGGVVSFGGNAFFWLFLVLFGTERGRNNARGRDQTGKRESETPPRWPNARNPRNQGARFGWG